MDGRRQKRAGVELWASLAMLTALGWAVSPDFRHVVSGVPVIALFTLFIAVVVGIRWRIWRNRRPPGLPCSSVQLAPISTVPISDTAELIRHLRSIDWFQFEKVVGVVFECLGYHVTRHGGANPDGGVDLLIEMDGQRTAVQCKHWKTWDVGVRTVREFLGTLTDAGLQKGIVITLNGFTREARQLAAKHGIEIVNETDLAGMLQAAHVIHNPEILAILKDTTKYCPKCGRKMVLRTALKGPSHGSRFWGCSGYPRCRYTMPVR